MMADGRNKRQWWGLVLLGIVMLIIYASQAGKMLVVDDPQPSDVIVVLAGETDSRPARALQLIDQGYAPRLLIDVPASEKIFGVTTQQLAQQYEQSRPNAAQLGICPIHGLSTHDEAHEVEKCLANEHGTRILIVTSDYHTHRALAVFRHRIRGKTFSMAAARDSTQFGTRWWERRQWAKTALDEWLRSLWWMLVDRWH